MTKFQCLLLIEFFLLAAVTLSVASVFMPDWRLGGSSQFMYPAGLNQGFAQRSYGLVYVEGLRKLSWAELSTSICDRWGLYHNTASLFEVAPPCTNSPVDPAHCTELFETHIRARCESYSALTLISWITIGVLSISTTLAALTSVVMLVISLGIWKRFVLAGLLASTVLAFSAVAVWGILSEFYFSLLTESATYPSAPLSLGFWLACASVLCLATGTFVFWRLSSGLKAKADRMSVSQASMLDVAERRYLNRESIKLIDDSDPE